jgi:hypothetical protein
VTYVHTRLGFSALVIGSSQRPLPDNTQHSQGTDIRATGGIRTANPSKQVAAGPGLRPLGRRDRILRITYYTYIPVEYLYNFVLYNSRIFV